MLGNFLSAALALVIAAQSPTDIHEDGSWTAEGGRYGCIPFTACNAEPIITGVYRFGACTIWGEVNPYLNNATGIEVLTDRPECAETPAFQRLAIAADTGYCVADTEADAALCNQIAWADVPANAEPDEPRPDQE